MGGPFWGMRAWTSWTFDDWRSGLGGRRTHNLSNQSVDTPETKTNNLMNLLPHLNQLTPHY
jgi:hypothetical protein